MCSALRSRTRAATSTSSSLTRLRSERGSANLLAFIFSVVILVPAMLLFVHLEGAKDARKSFDDAVLNTAKAAAAATYTTTGTGQLRISASAAQLAATRAYGLYKPFISDGLNVKLMNAAYPQTVTVTCKPDTSVGGEGCIGVTVTVRDEYKGGLLTHDLFPTFAMTGIASADLVVSQ